MNFLIIWMLKRIFVIFVSIYFFENLLLNAFLNARFDISFDFPSVY